MHDGRTLGSDTVTFSQNDNIMSRGLILWSTDEPDLIRHLEAVEMPDVPGPDEIESRAGGLVFPGAEARIVGAYREQIRPETRMLVIPHMDNTVGVRFPVAAISKMARAQGVEWLAVDAAQTVGMIPLDMSTWDVDFLATSPHKWLGAPNGLGVAVVRRSVPSQVAPMWTTWGQDRWGESARKFEDYGTRNIAELLTLGDAIDFHRAIPAERREKRLQGLWAFAREQVLINDRLQWGSPDTWQLGGSLYSIRI